MVQTPLVFDTAHGGAIHDAQLDFYGRILATASSDGSIRLWSVSEENPLFIAELKGHQGPVWQLSWSHPKYQNLLASCSYDHNVYIWKETDTQVWSIIHANEHDSSVNSVSFSPEEYGLNVAAASSDGTVSIITYHVDSASWSRKIIQAHTSGVLAVSWSSCSNFANKNVLLQPQKRIVTGGCDNQVRVWMYVDSTEEWVLSYHMNCDNLHTRWIRDVAWNPVVQSFHTIASCSEDGVVVIWKETDNQHWKSKQVISIKQKVWRVSWSVTGAILAVSYGVHGVNFYKENIDGVWELIQSPETQSFEAAAKGYDFEQAETTEVKS